MGLFSGNGTLKITPSLSAGIFPGDKKNTADTPPPIIDSYLAIVDCHLRHSNGWLKKRIQRSEGQKTNGKTHLNIYLVEWWVSPHFTPQNDHF